MNAIYGNASFQNIILTVLACVVLCIVGGCIYTFVRAIFFFIFSGVKDENKKKGWSSIRFMIVGILLTIVLLFFVPNVLKRMHIPGYDIYTPGNILNKAGDVLGTVFKLGDVVKESQQNNEYRGNMYYDTTPDLQKPSSEGYQL